MSHLGERVTALVDGELSAVESERAYAHAAGCRPCRDEIEAERLLKARLRTMPECGPSPDLLSGLMAMGAPGGPVRPRESHMPGMPWAAPVSIGPSRPRIDRAGVGPAGRPVRVPVPIAASVALPLAMPAPAGSRRPAGRAEAARPLGRTETPRGSWLSGRSASQRRLAMAVIGAVGAVGVGAVSVGAGTAASGAPPVRPQVGNLVVQHAATTVNLPFSSTGTTWQALWNSGRSGR
jgi:hypothetical protein